MPVRLQTEKLARTVSAAALILAFAHEPSVAQYKLSIGDAIEMSVTGIPDLKHRGSIGIDGIVSLPLLGEIEAAGLTLSELREKIHETLPGKAFRQRTMDGREYPMILAPHEITISIAEYRPVYLNGDVAKPGEQAFRPGLLVRQVIALAGGYDIMRFRMNNPFMESADLRSEYEALWTELAREQARSARLDAELSGETKDELQFSKDFPIQPAVAVEIVRLEVEQLRARELDNKKEKLSLRRSLEQAESRLAVLREQQKKEQEGVKQEAADMERVRELLQKGSVPLTRVLEAQRAALLSSTRLLQTVGQLALAERDREEINRRLEKTDDQRKIDLARELQDSQVRLAAVRARIQAVGEKLVYTGMIKSQLVRGSNSNPELTIFRKTNRGVQRIEASEDTALAPGDVVEVALRPDSLLPGLRDGTPGTPGAAAARPAKPASAESSMTPSLGTGSARVPGHAVR